MKYKFKKQLTLQELMRIIRVSILGK